MFKNILLATDFSEHSKRILSVGPALWRMQPEKVTLLHVVSGSAMAVPPATGGGFAAVPPTGEVQVQAAGSARSAAMAALSRFMAELNAPLPVKLAISAGLAADEICATAAEEKCDLIVLASNGHGFVRRIFLGSTAQDVVNNAPCDVLILRPQQP